MIPSMRLTNSGENRLRTEVMAMLRSFAVRSNRFDRPGGLETELRTDLAQHLARTQVAGENTRLFSNSRRYCREPQEPLVQHSQKEPRHGRAAFSISSNNTRDRTAPLVVTEVSFCCVSTGCVSRCPRYPGGAPISLATSCFQLELAAVHLEHLFSLPCKTSARASRSVLRCPWTSNRKSDGAPFRRETGPETSARTAR